MAKNTFGRLISPRAINKITKPIADAARWAFPKTCLACKVNLIGHDYPLCTDCQQILPFQGFGCRRCGQIITTSPAYCGRCLATPPPFDRCLCPFQYKTPISDLVRDFKYHERPELATPLAQILAREVLAQEPEWPELIISVPAHISRVRARGYNQSALLAHQLGKLLAVQSSSELLIKTDKTPAQAELSLQQRAQNLRNCFKVNAEIKAKSIAIIDDVVTSGATAAEIAKTLKRNGVDYVQVWGIAHTV